MSSWPKTISGSAPFPRLGAPNAESALVEMKQRGMTPRSDRAILATPFQGLVRDDVELALE
jgi:hypothetical protein